MLSIPMLQASHGSRSYGLGCTSYITHASILTFSSLSVRWAARALVVSIAPQRGCPSLFSIDYNYTLFVLAGLASNLIWRPLVSLSPCRSSPPICSICRI